MTWACGLLAATKRITVFATVHAPLFHPLIAAKEFVTADHIGEGRFGLNIVAGWNEDEFEMFGVEQRAHDERYDFAQEWMTWSPRLVDEDEFDFDGHYFKLKAVRAKPKPFGGTRPLIMNAGHSGAGKPSRCATAMRSSPRPATRGSPPPGPRSRIYREEADRMTAQKVAAIKAEAADSAATSRSTPRAR